MDNRTGFGAFTILKQQPQRFFDQGIATREITRDNERIQQNAESGMMYAINKLSSK